MAAMLKSVLIVSPDSDVSGAVGAALADMADIRFDTETTTLSKMNGTATELSARHDMVIFQTSPDDPGEIAAIRDLAAASATGPVLLALADSNISLSQARALKHAGVEEVLPIPLDSDDLNAQIARIRKSDLAVPQAAADQAPHARVIAVVQSRGGVGATTVAVNLADQLVRQKRAGGGRQPHKVALVDFDLQFGSVGSYLDLPEQDTLLQIAMDGTVPDENFLDQSMVTALNGVRVLAAPSKFAPLDALREDQVGAILDGLRQSNDYVVVDMPRSLVDWAEPIIQRADELMIVTDLSVASVRNARRLADFFTASNVSLPVEFVVNHQNKPMFQSRVQKEAAHALKTTFTHWLPEDPRAARAATDHGKPLAKIAGRSGLSKAVGKLAKATATSFPASHGASRKDR